MVISTVVLPVAMSAEQPAVVATSILIFFVLLLPLLVLLPLAVHQADLLPLVALLLLPAAAVSVLLVQAQDLVNIHALMAALLLVA